MAMQQHQRLYYHCHYLLPQHHYLLSMFLCNFVAEAMWPYYSRRFVVDNSYKMPMLIIFDDNAEFDRSLLMQCRYVAAVTYAPFSESIIEFCGYVVCLFVFFFLR